MIRWLLTWCGYVPHSEWEAQYHRAEGYLEDIQYLRQRVHSAEGRLRHEQRKSHASGD